MTIFITGGAGFIGSNFINYMYSKYPNYQLVCIDKLTYAGDLRNICEVIPYDNFYFYQTDITDKKQVYKLFERFHPDIVVNFAAETHVDNSIENPEVFLQTNIIGTFVLLDACNKFGIKRFHQVSTDEVYGDLPLDKPELSFTELSPLKPSSPYSSSKASADLLALAYYKTYDLPVTISRCSNNYGQNQYWEKLIPLTIRRILEDKPVPIYGNGLNVRDWIHVIDHCEAIDLILNEGKAGEIYNIGANNERNNLEIVNFIIDYLNKGKIEFVEDRKGHDLRYSIDASKIRDELDWYPKINFEEGLKNCIDFYKNEFKHLH